MDQIKRFITCNVPVTACNFRCEYCYLRKIKNKKINDLCLPPKELIKKLSVDKLGGICYFNLCADGETLMQPQLIEFVKCLAQEGHYVDIITNGTLTKKFDELLETLSIEEQNHVFIKFSFHYVELKNHNLLDVYVDNVNKIKNSNISYSIEITPYDNLIPYIDEIKNFSMEQFGALPHITVARDSDTRDIALLTNLSKDEYKKIWGQFNSSLFDFKFSTFNVKRKEFCYAGDWSMFIYLGTGEYRKCYFGNVVGNMCSQKSFDFEAVGKCLMPHCFNSHAFLALGCIPELNAPTYLEERDRIMTDGAHWVKKQCSDFFATKLYDNNVQYDCEHQKNCIKQTKRDYLISIKDRALKKLGLGHN